MRRIGTELRRSLLLVQQRDQNGGSSTDPPLLLAHGSLPAPAPDPPQGAGLDEAHGSVPAPPPKAPPLEAGALPPPSPDQPPPPPPPPERLALGILAGGVFRGGAARK